MTDSPLISIGMPVFNAEKTIRQAIRSILLQTFSDWELLIVDDGSTDGTVAAVREFCDERIRVIGNDTNRGIAARLNSAVALSRGEYFARMDGDDICYPRRLEGQLEYIQAHPEVDLTGAWMLVFGRQGQPVGKRARAAGRITDISLIRSVPLSHPTFFGKRAWFAAHPYAEWPSHFQDQQLLLRTIKHSNIHVIPEILLGYREEQLTLAKQVRYRGSFFRNARPLARQLGWGGTALLLTGQAAKLLVDAVAITTGLYARLLRYRAAPISDVESQEWQAVWDSVQDDIAASA